MNDKYLDIKIYTGNNPEAVEAATVVHSND